MKVGIIEDTKDIREMFLLLVASADDMQCDWVYGSAEEALSDKSNEEVDVFLVDVNLPGISGIEFIQKMKDQGRKSQFIVSTVYENDQIIFDALAAGATGYLLKNTSSDRLIESIREVHNGGSPMSLTVARRVVQYFNRPQFTSEVDVLTKREKEILELLAKGLLYKEIASQLGLSKGTVHIHIHNIYEKLHVQNRTEALNKAYGRSSS